MKNINITEWTGLSYDGWIKLFEQNDKNRLIINKNLLGTLSTKQKKLIAPSISAFQQGEKSEGNFLRKYADKFAEKYNENLFPKAIDWFIKEENFHSSYLSIFMYGEKITSRRKNWLDRIFTNIRRSASIESEIITLVTAEIVALTYYDLLASATDSTELKRICKQMIDDEMPHIVFQSYTISHFKQTGFLKLRRKILMEITTVFVYIAFYDFFKKNSCTFTYFRSENIGYLDQSEEIIKDMKKIQAQ